MGLKLMCSELDGFIAVNWMGLKLMCSELDGFMCSELNGFKVNVQWIGWV